jgi:hypothetical protein
MSLDALWTELLPSDTGHMTFAFHLIRDSYFTDWFYLMIKAMSVVTAAWTTHYVFQKNRSLFELCNVNLYLAETLQMSLFCYAIRDKQSGREYCFIDVTALLNAAGRLWEHNYQLLYFTSLDILLIVATKNVFRGHSCSWVMLRKQSALLYIKLPHKT